MIRCCPRCKKRKVFTDEYYVCESCKSEFEKSDDNYDLADDGGWKSWY